jgi:hypothetical protein
MSPLMRCLPGCLLGLLLGFPATAQDMGPAEEPTAEEAAPADEGFGGGFGDDMFSLEPVDPDLPEKIRKWNAECYSCHSDAGLKNPPRDDMDLEKLAQLLLRSEGFDTGVHTGMACKECHAGGYLDYPHGEVEPKSIKPCLECHRQRGGEIEKEFKASFHYQEHGDKFTCVSCHEAHYMQVAEKIKLPREIALQDNGFCRRCHESELMFAEFTEKRLLPNLNEVHDWLPNPDLHWGALRCVDCHTRETRVSISHEILPKDQAEQECVSCHSADSSLRTRLYRYLVKEDRMGKVGFINGFILNDAYVVGATRNELLDRIAFWAVALVLAGVLLHGLLRVLTGALRRRKPNNV